MAVIESVRFNHNAPNEIRAKRYGENWPVVYIINNKKEAYIGETVNAAIRAGQHFRKKERKRLTKINLISDDNFNKSVILDLENFLINHMAADGKFLLQNSNMGMHPHNYYQQEEYEKGFKDIWEQLRNRSLVSHSIYSIQNSDVFKYSPYKALNLDQYRAVDLIIQTLVDQQNENRDFNQGATILVDGGAGTGKTVLAVYLVKLLSEIGKGVPDLDFEMDPGYLHIAENILKLNKMKIGFVVPMQSLRATIKKVFKGVKNISPSMVLSSTQVPKDRYDLLIVDEAHRLRQRKALSNYKTHDDNNKKLGLPQDGTELDWVLKCSKNQILFYDSMQSVKPSDIDQDVFSDLKKELGGNVLSLTSQFRCAGGNDYVQYVKDLMNNVSPSEMKQFSGYDFRLFDDVEEMRQAIKEKDEKYGLCRVVAGYAWKWESKNNNALYDIFIDGNCYKWNSVNKDWVNSPDSIDEIGCIHTIQGYDLNYAGVIFGNEIRYDPIKKEIYVDKKSYYDIQGKTALKDETALKEYITNIYKTLLTRGIKGTYVYVCDENLRSYLGRYIEGAQ